MLGGRNPDPQPLHPGIPGALVAAGITDATGAGGGSCSCTSRYPMLKRTAYAAATTLPEAGVNEPVADFGTPAPGTQWRVERLVLAAGTQGALVLVTVGDLISANIEDITRIQPREVIVSADGPAGILVPSGENLRVAWILDDIADTTGYLAKATLRVESA